MVNRISNTTQMIIKKLGYHNSKNLYYFANINMCKDLSFHDKKVLNEIKPCAFFVVNGKPKVLFLIIYLKMIVNKNYIKKYGMLKFLL